VNLQTTGLTVEDTGGVSTIPLPGLSHTVTNARVYYENAGFRVSVAAKKRGDFLGEVSDFQDNNQLTFIRGNTTVDAQMNYDFPATSVLKGLSLSAAVNNFTNSHFIRFAGKRDSIAEDISFGRTYSVGASYKF
jgi:iron complex outermembrane receptor protein